MKNASVVTVVALATGAIVAAASLIHTRAFEFLSGYVLLFWLLFPYWALYVALRSQAKHGRAHQLANFFTAIVAAGVGIATHAALGWGRPSSTSSIGYAFSTLYVIAAAGVTWIVVWALAGGLRGRK